MARRPQRLRVSHVPDDADGADRAKRRRDGRLDRHVDGRSARNDDGRAMPPRRSRGSSSTTSDRPSKRLRGADRAAISARTRRSRRTPKSRTTCARSRRRSARSTMRNGTHIVRTNVRQRADGRWGLAYDPGHRRSLPDHGGAARPLAAVGSHPLSDARAARRAIGSALRGDRRRNVGCAGPVRAVVEIAGVGHAPMLMSPNQMEPVIRFLRD